MEIRAGIEPAYAVLQTALWAARVPDQRLIKFVGALGIEPRTSYLSDKRSTTELCARNLTYFNIYGKLWLWLEMNEKRDPDYFTTFAC